MNLTLDDVAETRARLEAWVLDPSLPAPTPDEIDLMCKWTHEWDFACEELVGMLEFEKEEAMRRKVRDEQRD